MTAFTDFAENLLIDGLFRGSVPTVRANSTAYSLGQRMMLGTSDLNVYECTTAGTSAASAPGFSTTLGATTTDGTAVFTAMQVGVVKRPLYFALFTANPSDTGGGTEVSTGAYARVALAPSTTNWQDTAGGTAATSSGTTGTTKNAVSVTFPNPTATYVVTGVALMDALTGGNMLGYGALTASVTVTNGGSPFVFNPAAFSFQVDN